MSTSYDQIYEALSIRRGPMKRADIFATGKITGSIGAMDVALAALCQPGGPVLRMTPSDGGKYEYSLRSGVTKAGFRPPNVKAREPKEQAPVMSSRDLPNTTSTQQSGNENPGGLPTDPSNRSPRESAPKVVSIAKPEPTRHGVDAFETIEARLRTNVEHLINAACMSADPVVRGFGVTVKELKGIRDLLKTTKGRDAA